ncbi:MULTISPECIES: hypothetical protein [Photorhabdus]|uniref:Uncharacterized protein n=1 Tax=Photorhabdus bodei TaxID=2029681 RepID=A0AAW6BJ17_9GAMM|nr:MULTISPECIES: hypothetical protein [Photorhabdus]MCC8465971.1 hypothetical protein [Photorhabdus bodei]MCT8352507.1 hypothetical protein [Photorhabdus kayaii]MDB6373619.1 hypothetical protein [Photorhabdus bodei]
MTGVSECSQQRGNLKDDGYTYNFIFFVAPVTAIHRPFPVDEKAKACHTKNDYQAT